MFISMRAFFYLLIFGVVIGIQYYLKSDTLKDHLHDYAESKQSKPKQPIIDRVKIKKAAPKKNQIKEETKSFEDEIEDLIKNNDESLQGINFKKLLKKSTPMTAIFRDGENSKTLRNSLKFGGGSGVGKTLNIVTEDFVDYIDSIRSPIIATASEFRNPGYQINQSPQTSETDGFSVDKFDEVKDCNKFEDFKNDYMVVRFNPGIGYDSTKPVPVPLNIDFSVSGPDYSHRPISQNDPDYKCKIQILRNRVVSLGVGGAIVLGLKDNKEILNGEGADFLIYENPFPIGKNFWQEYAYISVSKNPSGPWEKFECDPRGSNDNLKGCAGISPNGDRFDLSDLELDSIKYIKIQDTGFNFDLPDAFKTNNQAGFDLDAIKIINKR